MIERRNKPNFEHQISLGCIFVMEGLIVLLAVSLTGARGVTFSSLPAYFTVNGEPSTLTVKLSEIHEGGVTWLSDGKPFSDVDINLDETGNHTLSNIHQSNFFRTEFQLDRGNLTTSVTISELAIQFNGTKLAASFASKAVLPSGRQSDVRTSTTSILRFPAIFYMATVDIGNVLDNNTDVEITIVIIGDFGQTSPKNLGNLKSFLKIGGKKTIKIKSGSVGRIQKIKIGRRKSEDESPWYLRHISIEDPRSGFTYLFPVNGVMDSLDDGEIYPGMAQATNTSEGDCNHPPVGHPDFGIVGRNTTVALNCTSSDGEKQACNATWGCYAKKACTLVNLECKCQDSACGTGSRTTPNSILNVLFTCIALALIKVFTAESI